LRNCEKQVSELINRIGIIEGYIIALKKENEALRKENSALKQRIKELEAQCKSDSSNSSRPPSSDGYRKKPAIPRLGKGTRGGQRNHKGDNLKQIENPDNIIKCTSNQCKCGYIFKEEELEFKEKRQVFDLPEPRLIVTEYQIHQARCPVCNKIHEGEFPSQVKAYAQYGDGVKSFVVMLNNYFNMPFKKIKQLFGDIYGYPINESTISSANKHYYNKLESTEQIIKSNLIKSRVSHSDETGIRVEGRLQWLHNLSSELYTYLFVHSKRGLNAMESGKSILGNISNWLVHDGWHSYYHFGKAKHAMCGAHILRDLQAVIDFEDRQWARDFKHFLMAVYKTPFNERIKRQSEIKKQYRDICKMGEAAEPPPVKTKGRQKRTKGRNLVERLIRDEEMVLAFAFNEDVPFSNNLAERDIRPAKIKMNVAYTFRTVTGAEVYARIQSFISTTQKNNKNVFRELRSTFQDYNFITLNEGGK